MVKKIQTDKQSTKKNILKAHQKFTHKTVLPTKSWHQKTSSTQRFFQKSDDTQITPPVQGPFWWDTFFLFFFGGGIIGFRSHLTVDLLRFRPWRSQRFGVVSLRSFGGGGWWWSFCFESGGKWLSLLVCFFFWRDPPQKREGESVSVLFFFWGEKVSDTPNFTTEFWQMFFFYQRFVWFLHFLGLHESQVQLLTSRISREKIRSLGGSTMVHGGWVGCLPQDAAYQYFKDAAMLDDPLGFGEWKDWMCRNKLRTIWQKKSLSKLVQSSTLRIFRIYPLPKPTWLAGKSPGFNRKYIFKMGGFPFSC